MPHAREDEDAELDDDELDEDEGELNGESLIFDEPDDDDDDDEEDDSMSTAENAAALPNDREPTQTKGGKRTDDDMAADRLVHGENREVDEGVHKRQDELLDEGIEESFPASDPVSVKRIT